MWLVEVLLSFFPGISDAVAADAQVPEVIMSVFRLAASPVTFPWVGQVQLFFQGLALAICLIVIIVKGLSSNIMIPGSSGERSLVAYIWRSFWPVGVIVATPALLAVVLDMSYQVAASFTADVDANLVEMFVNAAAWTVLTGGIGGAVSAILFLVSLVYITTVLFQCIKRQIQLVVLSCIAPLVATMTVSESNAGDFVVIIKEMLGIGVITALQILMLLSAVTVPCNTTFASDFGLLSPLVVVAVFSAIKQMPKWIERYTLAPSVTGGGGRAVSMAGGMVARGAIMRAVG